MSQVQAKGWGNALAVFADRRAVIMLFLGFSAGIPILLIFSSLSLWLGEAGIEKKAVTFFSWAALGYSFKFVWAPLIDELPLPWLTRWLGKRRAWLLVSQCLIVTAIGIMAMSDPAQGHDSVLQMACGAVLLGFAAATQDIVIDAYRIELAEPQMQSALAATYNAGYRLGMIIAGAGALYLAAGFGSAKGNYIYQAWQWTYLIMAAVMLVGIITTLMIREPALTVRKHLHATLDYVRLVLVFVLAITAFIATFIVVGQYRNQLDHQETLMAFGLETARFLLATLVAVLVGAVLVKLKLVKRQIAQETWIEPLSDFFKRYGARLAFTLLMLIGFYRISDILSGVISNVFYQDLNFTKQQIATAVKVYGVLFTLIGGFLGGLLAQRFNVMKVMFAGAILASCTNLIFIGLVKSGPALQPVDLTLHDRHYQALPNEVGDWKIRVPLHDVPFQTAHQLTLTTRVGQQVQPLHASVDIKRWNDQQGSPQHYMRPIGDDNTVYAGQDQDMVLSGQIYNIISPKQIEKLIIKAGDTEREAKVQPDLNWSVTMPAHALRENPGHVLSVQVWFNQKPVLTSLHPYAISQQAPRAQRLHVAPLEVLPQHAQFLEVHGKVIVPYSKAWLYFAIVMDNLASGLAGAAFIAFLSSLTSVSFTAVQYAIFSSLMTLTPKILGGYSGTIVEHIGYANFFVLTTLVGLPVLILIVLVNRALQRR